MYGVSQFEMYRATTVDHSPQDLREMDWKPGARKALAELALAVTQEDGPVWVAVDVDLGGGLKVVDKPGQADFGLQITTRSISQGLALVACNPHLRINSLDALPLSLLTTRDSVLLSPSALFYITERVKPHVGPPTAAMLADKKLKCSFCRMKFSQDTQVVSCRCGAVYHRETVESHPDIDTKDLLVCYQKINACLNCHRPLTLEEYLTWDPRA